MKKIKYSHQAVKFLKKITECDAEKIVYKIIQYAENPETLKNQVKKLTNSSYYRLRIGDYRVIFDETGTVLEIIKVGNRGQVYKN